MFADYVAAILGLVRQGNSWSLNPFEEIRNADHSLFERGAGNQCSVEVRVSDSKYGSYVLTRLFPQVQLPIPLARDDVGGGREMG